MAKLNDVAFKAASKYGDLSGEHQNALDPTTIMTFLQLIMSLLEAFKGCQTPTQLVARAKQPKLLDRVVVRMHVRREMGMRAFRHSNGEKMVDALISTAAEMPAHEMQAVFDEV